MNPIGIGSQLLRQELARADTAKNEPPAQAQSLLDRLEAQDQLGNFEIQRLMSAYNQAETLASNVAKKQSDANDDVIGKIG